MSFGFLLLLPLAAIAVGVFVLLIVLLVRLLGSSGRAESNREETRMIQEMYSELSSLVSRIETLETLLLDSQRNAETPKNDVQQ